MVYRGSLQLALCESVARLREDCATTICCLPVSLLLPVALSLWRCLH
jgi:hypothetical protein